MTTRRSVIRRRSLAAFAAGAMLLSACSGGSDGDSAPNPTDVEDQGSDGQGGSETGDGSGLGGAGDVGDGAAEGFEYCLAAGEYYATVSALNLIGDDDNAAARQIFGNVPAQLDVMIDTAPSPQVAAAPQRVRASLTLLNEALAQVDWDVDALAALPNADALDAALTEVGDGTAEIEGYLVIECELDPERLQQSSVEVAQAVATRPLNDEAGSEALPEEPAIAADKPPFDVSSVSFPTVQVSDESGLVISLVPESWSEIDGAGQGDIRQLFAAPDLEAFRSTFAAPGLSIVSGTLGNAELAANNGFDALLANIGSLGCTVGETTSYGDGVYSGRQVTAACNTDGHPTYLISGVNATNDVFFLLVLAEGADFSGVYQAVTQTFRVD